MTNKNETIYQFIWSFIQGNSSAAEFEQWFIANNMMLNFNMPEDLYEKIAWSNLKELSDVGLSNLKQNMMDWIDQYYPRHCNCADLNNHSQKFIASDELTEYINGLDLLVNKQPTTKSISLKKCKYCGTCWHITYDEDFDCFIEKLSQDEADIILFYGVWPTVINDNPGINACISELYWWFVRGDISFQEFKKMRNGMIHADYMSLELSRALTKCYDESEPSPALDQLKLLLVKWLEPYTSLSCQCITWKNDVILDIGQSPMLDRQDYRTLIKSNDSLKLILCFECRTCWKLHIDMQNNKYFLQRLNLAAFSQIRKSWITP